MHRLRVLGPEGDARHVDVAVGHGHQAEVLLGHLLARRGELGGGAERGRLGRLAAGVGVDLGVEHQDVDVAAAWRARGRGRRSRCRRPSRRRRRSRRSSRRGSRRASSSRCASEPAIFCERLLERDDALALRGDAGLAGLVGLEEALHQVVADLAGEAAHEARRLLLVLVDGQPHAEAELGVVLEERVRPGRAAAVAVLRCRAWSAGCRRRSTSSRWRWRSAARSPKSWVSSLT